MTGFNSCLEHPEVAFTGNDCPECLKLRHVEVLDALRNMVGFFGGADVKLRMKKGFTQDHAQALREAKYLLKRKSNVRCTCNDGWDQACPVHEPGVIH